MGYGLITGKDTAFLDALLGGFATSTVKICEIGICHGTTAQGIKAKLAEAHQTVEYYGIDSQKDRPIESPFPEAMIFLGESSELYNNVPDGLDLLFIDGCHCANHVIFSFFMLRFYTLFATT